MPKQVRQTEGATKRRLPGFDGYSAAGGIGVVPRFYDAATEDLLQRCESTGMRSVDWLRNGGRSRLLRVLVDTHPMGAMALSNNLDLPFGAGATRFFAVKNYREGKGERDDSETAALESLWSSAYSSLEDLQRAISEALHTDGMAVVEAVPGGTGTLESLSIDGIYDVDSLTFRYRDADPAIGRAGRVLEQQQRGRVAKGWQEIDQSTVFTTANRYRWDRPCGIPIFSAFLTEGIADAYHHRGMSDGLRGAFYSRLVLQSTWSRFHELAKQAQSSEDRDYLLRREEGGLMAPAEFADLEMGKLLETLSTIAPDDIGVMPEGSEPMAMNINLTGIDGVLQARLLRVAQSLLQFPALLGITFGGREAWASQQVKVYVNRLDGDRARVNNLLARIGDLFLRLRGVDMVCRWEAEPITLQDLKSLAEARQSQLSALGTEVAMGFTTGESAAMQATGSGLADEEQHRRWLEKQTSAGQASPGATP